MTFIDFRSCLILLGITLGSVACSDTTQPMNVGEDTSGHSAGSPSGMAGGPSNDDAGNTVPSNGGCDSEVQLDPVIEREVRRMFGPTEGPIQSEVLAQVTSFVVSPSYGTVSDLTGLECMVNLRELDLRSGSVESLEPLSGLRHLVTVNVPDQNIRDLTPLNDKPDLARVTASRNAVESLEGLQLPPRECGLLYLNENPLGAAAEPIIERLCNDGWSVYWGNGTEVTDCNPQCAPRP